MRAKRMICALLCAAMLCVPVGAAETEFADVPKEHWAAESIRWAAHYGLVQGIGGDLFGLGAEMTRAAFATVLCRMMAWEIVTPETGSFTDNADPSVWYYGAVETARLHGAIGGESERFRPDEAITREEMAMMLVRAMGYTMLSGTVQTECPFGDVTAAQGYIALAWRMGLMQGTAAGRFEPKRGATREEAATLLLRAYNRLSAYIICDDAQLAPEGGVRVQPQTQSGAGFPMSPRAPMEAVYEAALAAGEGGDVILCAVPLMQIVSGGKVVDERDMTQEELAQWLAREDVLLRRSERHESSYAARVLDDGTTAVVWYESEEDIAVKVMLCRMLGLRAVYVER